MNSSQSPSSSKTKVSVFSRKDAFKFRIYRMLDEASEVMLFVLFWSTKCLKKKTQTYWDFFTKEEGLTPSKLKNDFQLNATMKHQLQSKPEKDFDITLISTCIKCACRNRSDVQDLLDHVKSIKDFRNAFIHAGLDDISSFIPKTNELQQLLTNLLKAAETAFSIPTVEVSNLMATMTNNVNEIATQSLSPSDMATCRSKLLLEKLRIDGISELKTIYEKLKYITPLHYLNEDIPLHVGMVYIQLEIVTADKHTGGHQVKYTDLFKSFSNWPGGNPSNRAQVILIVGPAGVGKTTLTRLLINDWTEGDSLIEGLVDFDFLIHAECRMPHIAKFSELISSLMSGVVKEYEETSIVKCLLTQKVLVIVDGLDEMNDSSKQLFQELLNIQTSGMTILVTTRAEAVELYYDLCPAGTCTTHLRIQGIPENKREEFAVKYHEEMKAKVHSCDTRGLIQYMRRMSVNFTDYWRIPLHLCKLVVLWALWPDTLTGVTTVTELLMETEVLITKQIKERVIKNPKYNQLSPEAITDNIDQFFRPELYRIAFNRQKELTLADESKDELKQKCKDLGLPHSELLGGFFVQRSIWTRTGIITKYSYSHRGIQDLYSALYILRSIITQKKEGRPRRSIRDLLENQELKQFQEVFKHLIGLVYTEEKIIQEETSEEVVQLLEESGVKDKDAWLDILSNVKANDTISRLVSKYVPDVLNLKGHTTITDSQSEIYSKLLATASPEKVTVSLRSSPNRVPGLQELFQTMCLLACEVEVYFHRDFLQPSTASSPIDSPLLRLFERGTITRYMGCATKDILAGLPDSIRVLYISVADQSQLEDLMSAVMRLKGLEWLCIHAAAGVDAKSQPALCNIKHILYKREGGGGDSSAEYDSDSSEEDDSDSSEEDDSDSSEEDEEITFTMREPTSTSLDKSHMEELTFGLRRNRTLDIDQNFVCKLSHLEKVLDVLKCFLDLERELKLNFLSDHLQHESSETNGGKGELASGVKRKICGESGNAKKYQATAIETQRGMISSGSAGGGSQGSVARAPRPPKPLQNLTSSFKMTINPVSAFVSDSHVPPLPPMTSKPSRRLDLTLDIRGDPEDIPRLRELLVAIGEKEGDLSLFLRHDFRHPRDGGSVLEEAIMQVFQSATLRVTGFLGQLSGSALAALPSGLEELYLAVKDDHHYQALLPALSSLPARLPKLTRFGLHVAAGQDAALLRPLPDVEFLSLYVSGVKEAPVERASRVVRALQSPRGYARLVFLGALECEEAFARLVEQLGHEGVRMRKEYGKVFASLRIDEGKAGRLEGLVRRELGCGFVAWHEEGIWSMLFLRL